MWLRTLALSAVFASCGAPTFANDYHAQRKPKPKKIASFDFPAREIEMLAVTPRVRAAEAVGPAIAPTPRHLPQQIPGYPKPALVSVDFRISF